MILTTNIGTSAGAAIRRVVTAVALLLVAVAVPGRVAGQEVGVKSNLLYDALLSPSLGLEVGLAPKWSFDLSGNLNLWPVNGHKWKHWNVQPELRYWLCERFAGHFFGLHALGGQYNFGNLDMDFMLIGTDFAKLRERRYEGWYAGLGLAYGYTWIFSKHWSMEAEIGVGWAYTRYDSFPCAECGSKIDDNRSHHYVGPTKAALNIIYVF